MSNDQSQKNEHASRRRFFTRMGKIAGGLGAMLVGGALSAQRVAAQAKTAANSLLCCSGTVCPINTCPSGTTFAGYCWSCVSAGATYICQDCLKNGRYYCTFPYLDGPCC